MRDIRRNRSRTHAAKQATIARKNARRDKYVTVGRKGSR